MKAPYEPPQLTFFGEVAVLTSKVFTVSDIATYDCSLDADLAKEAYDYGLWKKLCVPSAQA